MREYTIVIALLAYTLGVVVGTLVERWFPIVTVRCPPAVPLPVPTFPPSTADAAAD